MQRKLFVIYDVHKEVDIISQRIGLTGENLQSLRRYVSRENKPEDVQRVDKEIDAFYDSIEDRLLGAGIKQVYQDGFFIDTKRLASEYPEKYQRLIADIRASAELGSRSSGLVMKLYDQGASLEKTEDFELVCEEAELHSKLAELAKIRETLSLNEISKEQEKHLLQLIDRVTYLQNTQPERAKKRDQAIAQNINSGLRETGLFIIGAMHYRISQYFASDIGQVELMPEKLVIERRVRI